jgi:hypothetical protein
MGVVRIQYCFAACVLTVALLTGGMAWAGDLDDGISTYTDESVSKDDEVFKNEKNIKYTIEKAKSKASKNKNTGSDSGTGVATNDGGNMNSVLLGPGSKINGDVIIIDQSKGDKTLISR